MFVQVVEESDHRRSVSDVSLVQVARIASQHATHPAFSIDHGRAGISSSREGFVESNDGPSLGYEGAVIGKVGADVRVNLVGNAACYPGSPASLEERKGRRVVLAEFLGIPHLVKGNADVLNFPLTAGRIDEFVRVLGCRSSRLP